MRKNQLFFILFLICSLFSCDLIETDTSGKTTKKGRKYNGVKNNYQNGVLVSNVTYKDSLKNGPAFNFYPNGKASMEFYYKDNLRDGPYSRFYENGTVYQKGNYKKGEKDGIFKTFRENGDLKSEMPWVNGEPAIGLKEYLESGKQKSVPKIVVKQINTIKLNNKFVLELQLSDKSKGVKFYEGHLEEGKYIPGFLREIPNKKGKAIFTIQVPKGSFLMKTITITAKLKTRDKNYHILSKKVDVAIENR